MVMLNCPERGIQVDAIQILSTFTGNSDLFHPIATSCDSLVRVCMPCSTCNTTVPFLRMSFGGAYLAELTFYDDRSCPVAECTESVTTSPVLQTDANSTTPESPSLPTSNTTPSDTSSTIPEPPSLPTTITTPSNLEECSTFLILVAVATAILTALLATAVSVLVQIAICKCKTVKQTQGKARAQATPTGAEMGVLYEDMDCGDTGDTMQNEQRYETIN